MLENTGRKPLVLAETLRTDGLRGDKLRSGLTKLKSPFVEGRSEEMALTMDGRAIFDFAVRDVPKNIAQTIEKAELTSDDIDYFILHQANSRILDKMAKKLGANRDKFLQNMAEYGNTSAASIPLLLSESLENGKLSLETNQKLVLTGFGGGLTWGTMIIQL